MRLPSRLSLTLRIYLASVAQLLAVAGAVALVGWLSFRSHRPGDFHGEGRFALEGVAALRAEPARMRQEAERVRRSLQGKVTLYAEDGQVLVSNVTPALSPLSAQELKELSARGELVRHGPPPELALRLHPSQRGVAYGLFIPGHRPPPPPRLIWALLVAMLAAGIASVALARSFARPLRTLSRSVRAFGAGDLSVRAGVQRGDEFGELAEAFDDMAQRIAELVRSQQQLMADVSHELRTPLSRIRVALDLAAEGDAAMARQALAEISGDLAELERLIADVLQATRLTLAAGRAEGIAPPMRQEDVPLAAVIERSRARFASVHPGRTLSCELPGALPTLRGDAALLRRALDNLLDNAAAYSEADKPVRLVLQVETDAVELAVIDEGIGIAPEHLAHVGRPFYRTDKSRARRTGGLGLGVSLSRRIAEAHRGTLTLESRVGVGTTARLRLPR